MDNKLLQAAISMYQDRGWFSIPLGLDDNNLPKKPIPLGWTSLAAEEYTIRNLPWDRAHGLGIVLGDVSSRLCVLDIDDQGLFDVVQRIMGDCSRMVSTARDRGHMYFKALEFDTKSTYKEVLYQGRKIKIELKTNGTQVAAPPTKGYALLNSSTPQICYDIGYAFEFLMDALEDHMPDQVQLIQQEDRETRYPTPWREFVPAGERNDSLYIEAHKLREAGIQQETAIEFLLHRVNQSYDRTGINQESYIRTIKSAYSKGIELNKRSNENVYDDRSLFG
jgi:hypothetical protein